MNDDHPGTPLSLCQGIHGKSKKTGWKVCGIDCAGLDLALGDELIRIEYDVPLTDASSLRFKLAELSRTLSENRGVH
jgi:putative heme iron utilization protein